MTVDAKVFKSTTEEVKYHIIQMLSDGMGYSRNDILEYVRKNVKKPDAVTDNLFTGAVKSLTVSQKIDVVARGMYKLKVEETKQLNLEDRVQAIMENCKDRLNDVCCINILEVSESEMETAKLVKQFIHTMEKMLKTLGDTKNSRSEKVS